ncbi:MAG TPA: CGNR zinc finger domain-containing protein [Candidatus Limnocylindrales bacterium]|nr:CGNR zinc finger domain-containing protein [Candidatus Limnocylindrales bacterium]
MATRLSVDQLLWVANTRHGPAAHWHARVALDGPDHDHLADPQEAQAYLGAHHVPLPDGLPRPRDLARLAVVRESVRGLLTAEAPALTPDLAQLIAQARFRVAVGGGLESAAPGWAGLVEDLVLPYLTLVELRDRLRSCGNPLCRLVFVDQSKGHSRRWCDSGGCGNRVRVARHRHAAMDRHRTDRHASSKRALDVSA